MSQTPDTLQPLTLMPSKLCSVCDSMFKGTHPGYYQRRPHLTHGHLLAAAELGCYICRIIANSNSWVSTYTSQHNACFEYEVCFDTKLSGQRFKSILIAENEEESDVIWEFRVCYELDYNDLVASYTPPPSPLDPALLKLATAWIKECDESHPLCKPTDSTFRPTRLIQIIDSKLVKLVDPTETPTGQYVAFSHFWGKKKALKLYHSNLDRLCRGIQVQTLPKSYQEAISICLGLNLHFMWIDSLCIIQDSSEDWQHEAVRMKLVYGNSVLNLCSAAAVDNSEESLSARDATLIRPLQVKISWDGEDEETLPLVYGGIFHDDILHCPLRTHAWAFQEWYLSPRSLVLARRQLWWHCRQKVACEALPNGYRDEERMRTHHPDLQPDWMKDDMGQRGIEKDWARAWRSRVEHYVETELTEESDMLIAFSGIAQAFGNSYGVTHDYLAGLWRCQLPIALCWYVAHSRTSRSSTYKAPSWTWASVDGPCKLYVGAWDCEENLCVSVEDVWVTYANGQHTTGLVKGGAIKLRGHPLGPKKVAMVSSRKLRYFDDVTIPGHLQGSMMFDEGDQEGPLVSYLDNLHSRGHDKDLAKGALRRTEPLKDAQGSVFFLPIQNPKHSVGVRGIIMYQPVHQTGIFHRIGYFWSYKLPNGSLAHRLASEYPEQAMLVL